MREEKSRTRCKRFGIQCNVMLCFMYVQKCKYSVQMNEKIEREMRKQPQKERESVCKGERERSKAIANEQERALQAISTFFSKLILSHLCMKRLK